MLIGKCREWTERVIASRWFVPAQLIFTAAIMCVGLNMIGGVVLAAVLVWLLVMSDDTLAAMCPVMLIVMDVTAFYDDYYELFKYAWLLIPVAAAMVIHLIAYRGKPIAGRFLPSLVCLSIAFLLGGLGAISKAEYFSGVSLYYMLGLGAGLIPVYALLCGRLSRERRYDIVERVAEIVYAMALLSVLLIAMYYVKHWSELAGDFHTPFITYRNFCTTMMLMGLPMPCMLVKRSHWHLLGMAAIYMMMLIGGSRSALLFGTIELVMCIIYIYVKYPENRRTYRRIALIAAVPAIAACGYIVYKVFASSSGRFSEHVIHPDEARTKFYPRAVQDFLARPIFGWGIGNTKNSDIWTGVSGSIIFYHNAVLQAMASLGLVGCAAYLWQLIERVRLLIERRHTDSFLMLISFAGVLMMSQTNPGLFCPMPTAMLLIVIFAAVEFENSGKIAEKTALPAACK